MRYNSAKINDIDTAVNKISKAQWDYIRLIEHQVGIKFEGSNKRDASEFIETHKTELTIHIEDKKKTLSEMPFEDSRLIKRGVAPEDVKLIRQIEKVTGLSFSDYRQIRSEAYRFIEEHRGEIE